MKNRYSVFALIRAMALAWLLAGAVLTSCVSDETILNGHEPTGDNELLLRLRTPGSFAAPETRGLTFAQENAVNDVWVLAVDGANVAAIAKGKNPNFDTNDDYDGPAGYGTDEKNSASGTFSVMLPQDLNGKTVKLVVLANAEAILEGLVFIEEDNEGKLVPAAGVLPMAYTDVQASLIGNLASGQDGAIETSIPMWGEVTIQNLLPSVAPTVDLVRAVARLDVGVGEPIYTKGGDYPWSWDGEDAAGNPIPFVLTGVEVNSRTNSYYLIPELDVNGKSVLSQMDDAATRTIYFDEDFITNGCYTTQNIYLPESGAVVSLANPTMDDADRAYRTYVIVKGIYTGDNPANTTPTFYRLDFADEDEKLLDILRNHLYRFNITNVDGPGYTDIDDARTSRPMNMTADLVEIDEGASGYAVFDDEYYLSVDPGEFMLQAVAGSSTFMFQTDYPDWEATVSANEDGSGAAAWLTFPTSTDPTKSSISGDDNGEVPQTVAFDFDWNAAGAVRTAWITFKAGRMTLKVKVSQEVGVFAAPGMIGYIAGTDILTIRGSKEYAGSPVMGYSGDPNLARATGQPLEKETVYAAYFKPGSLVAVSSEYTNTALSAANVVNRPSEWTGQITNYASIPYVILSNIQANDGAELTTQTEDPVNPNKGTGDPCIYWGTTNNWDGDWKLPTGHSWYKEGDSPFGTDNILYPATPTGGNGSGAKSVAAVGDPDSFGIKGMVGGDGKGGQDWSMFLPAVGYRDDSGSVGYQGLGGSYLSSTYVYGSGMGTNGGSGIAASYLAFDNYGLSPSNMTSGINGFTVRCVPVQPQSISFLRVPTAPTPFHDATTAQSITVESNTAWTVTENIDWLEIEAGTASGIGNGSFSLKGTPDLTTERPASYYTPGKVTVTNGTNTVELDVNFLWGGYDDILYFDAADNNRLKIGKWAPAEAMVNGRVLPTGADAITAVDQLAFFKFGSVIGFTSDPADPNWDSDCIKFNPSQYTVGASGDILAYTPSGVSSKIYASYNKVPNIPGYNNDFTTSAGGVGEDNAVVSVSDATYNDWNHIRMGKGDPCQWIGLTADEIKDATSPAALQTLLDDRDAKYKGWRLPTARENVTFLGPGDKVNYDWETWSAADGDDLEIPNIGSNNGVYEYDYWREGTGYAATFGQFPTEEGYRAEHTQILPVVQSRHQNDQGNNSVDNSIGVITSFWSSTLYDGSGYIQTTSIYEYRTMSTDGYPFTASAMVRCVR